jgi:PAS domain S-box-containing protein
VPYRDTKILIVDDRPANLVALEAVLGSEGYTLVRAASGAEALQLIQQQEFACILLDVQMPVMDGFETARRIRAVERLHTPIIFLTANYPTELDTQLGYRVGAVDYLAKPLNMDIVRAKVAVFAELARTQAENRRQAVRLAELERKEAARARALSESRYQSLVEGIEDGIVWIADGDMRRFAFVSHHAARIAGYPLSAWLGEDDFWAKHLHADDEQRVGAAFAEARSSLASFTLEHRFVKKDGTVIWLHSSVHCERPEGAATPEFRGLSIDVTHLKEVEDALRSALRARDEFLSIASHELRTPITPLQLQMQSYIRFIEAGRFDVLSWNEMRDMLKLSGSQVSRLSRLISQLLEVSRIDIGRFKIDPKPADIGALVQEVVRQFHYEIVAAGCDVQVEVPEPVVAEVDTLRFEQVVVNLLSNALKYAPKSPVVIRVGRNDTGAVLLSVRDKGMGIAKKDQKRIFDRYERAISEHHYGGLGLGLYISSQIVQHHGGKMWVESAPGRGALFCVEVPKH